VITREEHAAFREKWGYNLLDRGVADPELRAALVLRWDGPYSRYNDRAFLELRQYLWRAGYDGLCYRNQIEHRGSMSWVILRPAQAMSVFKFSSEAKLTFDLAEGPGFRR
jgi:hypothetical protein